ncbi:MAG: Ig-like domain-containing protein [Gemmatimonadetes bacterium]|nr:Ig-like domain-containing protein [Gemmatimonadota bacterium]
MMPSRPSSPPSSLATRLASVAQALVRFRRRTVGAMGPRRAMMAATYALLLVSCDSPFAPDDQTVARLEPNPLSLSLTVGEARNVSIRVLDDAGKALDSRQVFWSSQNPAIATVTQAGLVTAVSQGGTQIAASAGGKSAILPVTVNARPVSLVRVTPSTATIVAGTTTALSAEALDAGGATVTGRPVIWATSNATIATVTSTGVVTGVAAGAANVTATVDGVAGASVVTVQPVPIASISLTPATGALILGQSLQLVATPRDAAGNALNGRSITWSSNAPTVASVSSTGLVTALATGAATITAASEGRSATSRLTVSLVPVDTVSVTPRTTTLAAGQVQQLTARVVDSAGNVLSGRAITWDTDQPTIATVSNSGLVTALTNGRATISASTGGKSGTATITVTPVPVASLSITPGSGTLLVGGTLQLSASARDASNNVLPGRVITWISGAPSVATVTQAGLVTAVGTGSALIFAASEGVSTSVSITVSSVGVASVRISPPSGSIAQARTLQLSATPVDAQGNTITGRTVSWNSSAPAVASVSSSGLVSGIAPGTANVTATVDGVVGTAPITVTPTPVATATIIPGAPTVTVGSTLTLTLLLADSSGAPLSLTGRNIGWAVSNQAIASVSTSGTVTALAPGTVTVQATVEGVIAQSFVTVTNIPVASVTLTPSTAALQLGQKQAVTAVARDASNNILIGRPVTWSSSAVTVATVGTSVTADTNTITTVGTGTATIRATIGGVTGVSTVSVTAVPIASISVSPTPVSVEELKTLQLTATARDAANNILTGRTLVWSSSNNAIASVSQTGLVTANVPGTVTISASAPGQGVNGTNPTPGTSAVTVTFAPVATATILPNNPLVTVGLTTQPSVTLNSSGGQVLSATGRTVSWSLVTSPANAATINATTGLVTGVAAGTGTITVSASSPGQGTPVTATAALTITAVQVARVAFTPLPGTLHIGSAYARTVTATAFDASNNPLPGRLIAWSSENSGISVSASSSTNGQVTITGNGSPATVKVYAQAQGGSGTVTDSIAVPTDFVAVGSASTVTLPGAQADSVIPGGANARSYTATPRDSAGNVISGAALGGRTPVWSLTGGATFASITPSGATATVTPNAPGTVTVQADWTTTQPSATLKILQPVSSILLTVAPDSFFIGGTAALVATARDASNSTIAGRTVAILSLTPSVVTVGTNIGTGSISTTVTGVSAPGGRAQATITASAPFDGISNSTTVRVLAPVSSITVATGGVDSIFVNGNIQATATLRDASNNVLTGRPITWNALPALVATAAQTGVITGVAAGTATIQADAEGRQGTKSLLVQEPVNSIAITTPDSSVFVGQTQQVAVVLQDRFNAALTGRLVTYTSSQTSVATVSSTGLVTAVASGTTNITATSEGKTSTAIPFTVSLVPVASVQVSATQPPNVHPTHTFPATVQAFDASNAPLGLGQRTIVWSSNNPAVATVAAGTAGSASITAVSVGTATITATVDGIGATTPITVVVKPVPVASVTLAPTTASIQVGSSAFLFTPTPRDSNGVAITGHTYTFSWSSGNVAKATVNPTNGTVAGVDSTAATPVQITATATSQGTAGNPNPSGSSALTVTLIPIGSVVISPSSETVTAGTSKSLMLEVRSAAVGGIALAGRRCTIASDDINKLTAVPATPIAGSPQDGLTDSSGQLVITITGVAPSGSADPTVTASCEGVQSNKASVVVQ